MELEEVETLLGDIYKRATMAQSHVRVLLHGPPEPIDLTKDQKKKIKKKVVEDITDIANKAKAILEGLS